MQYFLLIFLLQLVENIYLFRDPFQSQPRIEVKNGNLVFQSGLDKNISLKTTGILSINGQILSSHQDQVPFSSSLHTSTNSLSIRMMRLQSLAEDIENMKPLILSINKTLERLFGGNRKLRPRDYRKALRDLRRTMNRVKKIEEDLNKSECNSNPCKNGATCINGFRSFHCTCLTGWQGKTCEEDVNECALYYGTDLGCQNGATCINTPGSYRCQCPPHKYGIHCTEDQDDCTSQICGHGTCVGIKRTENQPAFKCICDQGWTTGTSAVCDVDIDECASGTHCSVFPSVSCINYPGGFTCGPCPNGYVQRDFHCIDINECITNNGGCSLSPQVFCHNIPGGRICGPCPPGYSGDGITCQFNGVCSSNNGGCSPLAICRENLAISATFRSCICPTGYQGNGEGPNGCILAETNCNSSLCLHGSCISTRSSFSCVCQPHYTGHFCDIPIKSCDQSPCLNGATCISEQTGYKCLCTSAFHGTNCEIERSVCSERFNEFSGTLSYPLPGTYPTNFDCHWVIETELHHIINITINFINFEDPQVCSSHYLLIVDGPLEISHEIAKFCNSITSTSVQSSGNTASIFLHLTKLENVNFNLTWNSTFSKCGGYFNSSFGSISSPGYPSHYPPLSDCIWNIVVKPSQRIQLHFALMSLEKHNDCTFDYLKILDGPYLTSPQIALFCSTTLPAPITSSGHIVTLNFHSDYIITDRGFHLTYSAIPALPGCGGLLTSSKGIITNPQHLEHSRPNLECDWAIRINKPNLIILNITSINFESDCIHEFLEIYDGQDESAPIIGRFCSLGPPIISTSSSLFLRYHSEDSKQGKGFTASYNSYCKKTFYKSNGTIYSTDYLDSDTNIEECTFQIIAVPGFIIRLEFTYFGNEKEKYCESNFLEVYDGLDTNSTKLARICGEDSPAPILSSFNIVTLIFRTIPSTHSFAFIANYSTIDLGCGGILNNTHGVFTSPNHPNYYKHSAHCSWLLSAPPGYIIQLTFSLFSLEHHDECIYDYVQIIEKVSLGIYCGNQAPPIIRSTGNRLLVIFKSDTSDQSEGFIATYSFMNASLYCGGVFAFQSGYIRSPGFPNSYPNNRLCVWQINAPDGKQIQIKFNNFSLEYLPECSNEFLAIYNGRNEDAPLIGKYCGDNIPPNFISHSNYLYLVFKSDGSVVNTGFEIYYDTATTGCGGVSTSFTGSIISPNYPSSYNHNAECKWLIKVAKGSRILVIFNDLTLEDSHECKFDHLDLFDGSSERSPLIARICKLPYQTITTTGSTLMIRLRTDYYVSHKGFKLSYITKCTNTIKGFRGVIESPNYPSPFPSSLSCSWKIIAPLGNKIALAFHEISLGNCSQNLANLTIIDGFENTTVCNREGLFNSTNNIITILFSTAKFSQSNGKGFRIEWRVIGCGDDIINKPRGTITSPNYPHSYPTAYSCIWHITVPLGQHVEITIVDFNLEMHNDCAFDNLKLYGGPDDTAPLLLTLCSPISAGKTYSSSGNSVTLVFYSDRTFSGRGFKLLFKAHPGSCGGLLNNPQGTFVSPHYPAIYDAFDDCTWFIRVSKLHAIQIEVEDLKIVSSPNCTNSYFSVSERDQETSTYIELARLCGTPSLPVTIKSMSSAVKVRFKAGGHRVDKGFKASYKVICGGTIKLGPRLQTISLNSPDYPRIPLFNMPCVWNLVAPVGERISLRFDALHEKSESVCEESEVEIREGGSDGPLIGRYCESQWPPLLISEGNSFYISVAPFVIFHATATTQISSCGGTFGSNLGHFTSPGYPNSYWPSADCIWTIHTSVGNKIYITFHDFQIDSSEYCNLDYVEIRELITGNMIGRFCDSIPLLNQTSFSGLHIKFHSDSVTNSIGFRASFALVNRVDHVTSTGQLSSPRFPGPCLLTSEIIYTITVPDLYKVKLEFIVIEILWLHKGCRRSALIIEEFNGGEIAIVCGHTKPEPIISKTNSIKITFKPDDESRFLLKWSSVNETEEANEVITIPQQNSSEPCSSYIQLFKGESYYLTSPGYPGGYKPLLNCNWIVSTVVGHKVFIEIIDMNIEGPSGFCFYDKLTFHDVQKAKLINKLCGRQKESFNLTSPFRIRFSTDRQYNGTGFKLLLQSICGGNIQAKREPGLLDMSYVGNQTHCEWLISARSGRKIKISFDSFNIGSNEICTSYIWLHNGISKISPSLENGKYCGSTIPVISESSSNNVYIVYHSEIGQQTDFRLHYHEVSLTCGGSLTINSETEITTPNYPVPPPHRIHCEWTLTTAIHHNIRIDFQLTQAPCDQNLTYVAFYDGGTQLSSLLGKYCPKSHQNSIITSDNIIFIRYVTDENTPNSEMKITASPNICGGTWMILLPTNIFSPKYPSFYDDNMDCTYVFIAPESYIIQLTINQMEIDCKGDFLVFSDSDSNELARCTNITSPTNKLIMKFKSDTTGGGKWKITVKKMFDSCFTDINADSDGIITSPRYPLAHPVQRTCPYIIKGPIGRSITLQFTDYRLKYNQKDLKCIDEIWIESISKIYGKISELPCNVTSLTIRSYSNYLILKFHTFGLAENEGFKATFSVDEPAICGGEISVDNADFESYKPETFDNRTIECFWSISSSITLENKTAFIYFDEIKLPIGPSRSGGCFGPRLIIGTLIMNNFIERKIICNNLTNEVFILSPKIRYRQVLLAIYQNIQLSYFRGHFGVQSCGGLFYNFEKNITSPSFPDPYPAKSICQWSLSNEANVKIRLTFSYLQLPEDCSSYIIISFLYHQRPFKKICGSKIPEPITTPANDVQIFFRSNSSGIIIKKDSINLSQGFSIFIKPLYNACGGSFVSLLSIISPGFPEIYPQNIECIWTLAGIDPGNHVNISFDIRFSLETSINCTNDYVAIEEYRDEWKEIKRFCGIHRPPPFIVENHKIRIIFRSDSNEARGDGFSLVFNRVCGEIFTESSGEIFSENYPQPYRDSISCNYLIKADPHEIVTIEFVDFSLENSQKCNFDYVIIYRGENISSPSIGPFCGDENPGVFTSKGTTLIYFKSDIIYNSVGFHIRFNKTSCGGIFNNSGIITSLNMGDTYPPNSFCEYILYAGHNRSIDLRFLNLDLETCIHCQCDYVSIHQGPNSNSTEIAKLCFDYYETIKSTGEYLYIQFKSDSKIQNSGFKASFRSTLGVLQGCGGFITTNGTITSPLDKTGRYENNLDCTWTIMADENSHVTVNFTKFDLEPDNSSSCIYDFVEVYDGTKRSTHLIDRFCGNTLPGIVISSQRYLIIYFHTDDLNTFTGFTFSHTLKPSICGGRISLANSKEHFISSPNYPHSYDKLRCYWSTLYSFNPVSIKFYDLDVDCSNSYLEIRSFLDTYRLCGNETDGYIYYLFHIAITFSSSEKSNHRGFNLSINEDTCDRDRYENYGRVKCLTSLKNEPHVFNINVTSGLKISLYFIQFSGQIGGNFEIEEDNKVTRYSGFFLPLPYFSYGHLLKFRSDGKISYSFTYTSSTIRGCGGNLTGNNGAFTSPLFPNVYNKTSECVWNIKAFLDAKVVIMLKLFGPGRTGEGCYGGYIEIGDGKKLLGPYCGQDKPRNFVSEKNFAFLKMYTTANNTGFSFSARFASAKGDSSSLGEQYFEGNELILY